MKNNPKLVKQKYKKAMLKRTEFLANIQDQICVFFIFTNP